MTEPTSRIDGHERLLVGAWALLVLLVSFGPLAWCHATAEPGWSFTGFHAGPLNDYQGYMAWMRQARDGHLLFLDKFTTEPQERISFHPLFWLIGTLSRSTGSSILTLWYLAQALGLVLMVVAIYCFAAELTDSKPTRALALVLATTASGLGWLLPGPTGAPAVAQPIDLWLEEANQFRVISSSYFTMTLGLALMLFVAVRMLRYLRSGRLSATVVAGLLALLLAMLHPYDLVTLYAVLGVWTLVAGRGRFAGMGVLVAMSAPYLLYGLLAVRFDPVMSRVDLSMEMPTLRAHLVGWGLPFALALVALLHPRVRREHRGVPLLAIWVGVNLALLLVPVEFRRKLSWGLDAVFCLLAAMAIRTLVASATARLADRPGLRRALNAAGASSLVVFMAVGSVQVFADQFRDRTFGRFLPDEVLGALADLDAASGEEDVVLAGPALTGFVPGWSGAVTVWGHWALTVDLADKRELARRLLSPHAAIDQAEVARILREQRIRWVLLDKASAASTGQAWPVPTESLPIAPFVEPLESNGWVTILEVSPARMAAASP